MKPDFLHDAATTISRALVNALAPPSAEDELHTFTTLLPIVARGLELYGETVLRATNPLRDDLRGDSPPDVCVMKPEGKPS